MAEKTCNLEQENPQDDSKQAKKLLEQERRRQTPTALETRGEHRDTAAERSGNTVQRNLRRGLTCRTQMLGRVPWYAFRDKTFAQCSPPASHSAATLTSILPRGMLTPAAALVKRNAIRARQSLLWTST
jgi:hypothetical protein